MPDDTPAYTFNGKRGEFIAGVPARDLTVADVRALDQPVRAELKAYVKAGGAAYQAADGEPKQGTRAPEQARPKRQYTRRKPRTYGEQADPVDPNRTDADITAPGQDVPVPVRGEAEQPAAIASDRLSS